MQQSNLLEREAELTRLAEALAKIQNGHRQIGFVSGGAGVGKTALVHRFLSVHPGVRFGAGRCLQPIGDRKPFHPLLEALGSTEIGGFGASRERILVEFCRLIEERAQIEPFLLILEDLQWADFSTLDVIRKLANRSERAQLLILLTVDPVDMILASHPLKLLKQELQARKLAWELPVDELSLDATTEFLRSTEARLPGFAQKAYQIAGGNPGFLAALAEFSLANPQDSLPRSLRQLTGTRPARKPAEDPAAMVRAAQECIDLGAHVEAAALLSRAVALAGESGDMAVLLAAHEQMGALHRAGGQLEKAAAEYEGLGVLARQHSDLSTEVRSKLPLAEVTAWFDRTRCLKASDEASTLIEHVESPLIRADVLGQTAYWNLLFRGWSAVDSQDSANAVQAARKAHDDGMLAFHACRNSFFQSLRGEYREAYLIAQEGISVAYKTRRYNDYSIGQFFDCWALLHCAKWTDLRIALDRALDLATQNRHDQWIVLYRVIEAWMHIHRREPEEARSIAEEALSRARRLRHKFSQQSATMLLGYAELGLGNLEFARDHFVAVSDWQVRERVAMDWIIRMPLQQGMVDLCLAYGDVEGARAEADLFQQATALTVEPTWRALSHLASAKVALAAGETALARREVREGCLQVDRRFAPLAQAPLQELAESLDFPCFDPVAGQAP